MKRKPEDIYILVACEESQAVTKEFRNLGFNAFSCDIDPCSGGHPEWHLQQDVIPLLKQKWDIVIAHPPCTHLANSGAKHFKKKRIDGRQRKAIEFFMQFLNIDCKYVAVENPMNIIGGEYIPRHFPDLANKYSLPIKKTQTIQPYEHGDKSRKTTWLWLKGLPNLMPTNIVEPIIYTCKNGKTFSKDYMVALSAGKDRGKLRSKTYPGIAKAMATQWGKFILNQ